MYDPLSEKRIHFHDLSETTYVQATRDVFDVVRLYYIKNEDIVKKEECSYKEFSEEVFNNFVVATLEV